MKSLLFQIFSTTAILFCVEKVVTQASQVIACEHAPAKTVSCPAGHYINVITAFYGRKQADRCGHNSNTNCLAASSPGIIKNNCQGKNSCILKPSNSVFGDPCRGVVKYIEIEFECLKNVVIACEHAPAKTVSCPAGHYINVINAFYGRKQADRCGHNSNTNCLAASSPGIIKNNCQGKNSCILKPSNSVFGDPCRGVVKYIEIEFECLKNVVIACEHAPAKTVSCPAGHYINVINAFYGRKQADRCGHNSNTNCLAASSPGIIKNNCQGKTSCILKPSNSVFGDPCRGVVKYIEIEFECLKNVVIACEHAPAKTVSCPAGHYINVINAFYGRKQADRCGHNSNTNCLAASSPGIIKNNCQGKNSCILKPSNSVFGDPCRGVVKYIEIEFECLKNVVIACEHAPAKTVSCPAGHYINVINAFYGRKQADRCGHNSNTNCLAASSPGIIKNNCQGKNSCILKPSNSVFGDPCRGVVKYIELEYECF